MRMLRHGVFTLLLFFSSEAFAENMDFTVYGGAVFNNGVYDDITPSITASLGIDLPEQASFLGIDQIRSDFTYLWDKTELGPLRLSNLGAVNSHALNFDTFQFHVGPNWRAENIIGPVSFSVGVQAGLTHTEGRSRTDPVAGFEQFNQTGASTAFSYQFPVELEIPLADNISFSTRYRPVGQVDHGSNQFLHIVEGGIRLKF